MITRKLFLRFPKCETEKPIVYHLVKDYNLIINIFRAKVTANEEGYLVLDVTGREEDIDRGMDFVRSFQVTIDPVNKGVRWDPQRCTHCGNCISHCPTHALHIVDPASREIGFQEELCIECLNCLENCPFGACSSAF
ncbi:MAG: 4Fe-4S binding protein [Lentisphaeria bacterium]|nr:4Fe-4S binding protein [Lentisphaeria bacterium]